MFLLVSVRHVGAHSDGYMALDGHQHGVSIQISISKFCENISSDISYTKYSSDLNLGEGLCIFSLDFIYSTVVIFILIYFEWRDTENQQLV